MQQMAGQLTSIARPCFSITASECDSAQWQRLEPQLATVVALDLTRAAPCCLPTAQPAAGVPDFGWEPSVKEDNPENIKKALAFLKDHVLPDGVTAVPVQSMQWLSGAFMLGSMQLVIKQSKTDFLFILSNVWNVVKQELRVDIKGHRVEGDGTGDGTGATARLRDRLPQLLPSIIGFYEVS